MTSDIGLVLAILAVAVILFSLELVRVDLVALMVLVSLLLTDALTVDEAFSGFSNPAVITVWAIYIVSASLTHTGIADYIGRYMARLAGKGEKKRLIFVIMVTTAAMSAFMNNIGAAAVLMPVVVGLGRRFNIPVSKLLIPLAFASLLGGTTTLIGTPPNLLVSDALAEAGLETFSLFDFTPMGLIILGSSIVYMMFIGRHLLPSYVTHNVDRSDLDADYHLQNYLTELHVQTNSPLIGKTIVDSRLGEVYDVTVMGVVRDDRSRLGILPNAHIQAGDILFTKGEQDQVEFAAEQIGATIVSPNGITVSDISSAEVGTAQLVISQKSTFVGRTLRQIDFRGRFGLTVLAIWREEQAIVDEVADESLRFGDTLLVHGRHERIAAARDDEAFLSLKAAPIMIQRLNKAPLNMLIFVSMITTVGVGWLHISEAAVLGAVLSILTGCIEMDEAYQSIEWKSVFLIAGMLPMGIAMEQTGAALYLADVIVGSTGGFGPRGVLIGLFILTTIITAFMSNAAAAVLVAPIAIQTAISLNANPQAFVMGIAMAASNAYLTPIGHQSCVLVYGPGGYRFIDFTRVGLPLTLMIWVLMAIFLPIFFPV